MRAQGLSRTNERERGGNGGVPQKRCENLIRQKVTHKYTRKRCSGSVPYKKEKSVKKTVEKWSTNCFILYLPHKSKKVLCVSKSPLARWRDAEKRERNRKPDWDWTVCLKRSKCRAFGRMFFIIIIFFLFGTRKWNGCCWTILFEAHFALEKGPTSSHHHHHHLIGTRTRRKRKNDLI